MQRKVGGTFHKTFFQREDWEPNVQKSCGNLPQNLFRREDWETNAKKSWGNLPQNPENLFRGQPNLPQGPRGTDKTGRQMLGEDWKTNVKKRWGNLPHNLFWREDWETNAKKNWGNLPRNLFRREDWETNVEKSWGNVSQNPENLFKGQRNLPQSPRRTDKTGRQMLGEPSTEPFSRPTGFAPRNARGGVCPETFTMAKDPKANGWGKNSMMLHSCHLWLTQLENPRVLECMFVSHSYAWFDDPSKLAAKLAEALGSRAFVLKSCPPDSL